MAKSPKQRVTFPQRRGDVAPRAAQETRLKFVIKISCGVLPADNVAGELQRA